MKLLAIKITAPVTLTIDDRNGIVYDNGEIRHVPKAVADLLITHGAASKNLSASGAWDAANIAIDGELTLNDLSTDLDGNVHAIPTSPAETKFFEKGGKPEWRCFVGKERWLAGQSYWLPGAVFKALNKAGAAVRVPYCVRVTHAELSREAIDLGWLEHPGGRIDACSIAGAI